MRPNPFFPARFRARFPIRFRVRFPVTLLVTLLVALPLQALADVQVSFRDGAPKDSFVIENVGACDLGGLVLTLDMTPSAGALIFDTTSEGAGVEVFQPFELTRGAGLVPVRPQIVDGQKTLSLTLSGLAVGQVVSFTIDVDDTTGAREITVSGSEIAGSVLRVESEGEVFSGVFDGDGVAVVGVIGCVD